MKRLLVVLVLVAVVALIALMYLPRKSYIEPVLYRNFITEEEQEYILEKSKDSFSESTVVGEGGNIKQSNIRQSETAWVPKDDPVIKNIYERALEKTGLLFENAEDLQVVKYQPGGFYKVHQDAFCDDVAKKKLDSKGQRKGTFIVYLNDDYEGGGTEFPELGKVFKGNARDALYFRTLDKNGECCDQSLHSGLEVTRGQKMICNMWFH